MQDGRRQLRAASGCQAAGADAVAPVAATCPAWNWPAPATCKRNRPSPRRGPLGCPSSYLDEYVLLNHAVFNSNNLGLYISVIGVAIGIIIAFIITNEFAGYNTAANNASQEANIIYILYQTLQNMPNSQSQQTLLQQYLCNIITVEFPALENGNIPPDNTLVNELVNSINGYIPDVNISNQATLYATSVNLLNEALFLRTQRIQSSTFGIATELWWVILICFVIIIIATCLFTDNIQSRAVMVIIVSIVYASLIFLIVALDYPFRGDFSLSSESFQFVANLIGLNCS